MAESLYAPRQLAAKQICHQYQLPVGLTVTVSVGIAIRIPIGLPVVGVHKGSQPSQVLVMVSLRHNCTHVTAAWAVAMEVMSLYSANACRCTDAEVQ